MDFNTLVLGITRNYKGKQNPQGLFSSSDGRCHKTHISPMSIIDIAGVELEPLPLQPLPSWSERGTPGRGRQPQNGRSRLSADSRPEGGSAGPTAAFPPLPAGPLPTSGGSSQGNGCRRGTSRAQEQKARAEGRTGGGGGGGRPYLYRPAHPAAGPVTSRERQPSAGGNLPGGAVGAGFAGCRGVWLVHGRGGAPPRSAGRSGRLRGGFRERKWRRRRAGEMARGRGGLFAAGSVWATGTGRCWLKAGILSGNWVEPCGEAAGGTSEVALRGRVRAGGGEASAAPEPPRLLPTGAVKCCCQWGVRRDSRRVLWHTGSAWCSQRGERACVARHPPGRALLHNNKT